MKLDLSPQGVPYRKRMQWIVCGNLIEFLSRADPLVLIFGNSATEVMKVVCIKRLRILSEGLIQRRSRTRPIVHFGRCECPIDGRFEYRGEQRNEQGRN